MANSENQIYSGHSHSFDIGIAETLGLGAACVFNHIVYWLRINAGKDNNIRDGRVWMYETQADIAKCLTYLSIDEIKKIMVKLVESGLLIKANYNENPFDHTNWYTTADPNIIKKTLTKVPNGTIGSAKAHDPKCQTAPCIYNEQEEHIQKEQQNKQQPQPVSVCPSEMSNTVSVPSDDPSIQAKSKAFNWFMQIGCDIVSATQFVENYSLDEITKASLYVENQIKRQKAKGTPIQNIVGYLRKTLEGRYWEKRYG